MSYLLIYFGLGTLWAEIGLLGHWQMYKEMPSISFYLFMIVAWPVLFALWVKEMFE